MKCSRLLITGLLMIGSCLGRPQQVPSSSTSTIKSQQEPLIKTLSSPVPLPQTSVIDDTTIKSSITTNEAPAAAKAAVTSETTTTVAAPTTAINARIPNLFGSRTLIRNSRIEVKPAAKRNETRPNQRNNKTPDMSETTVKTTKMPQLKESIIQVTDQLIDTPKDVTNNAALKHDSQPNTKSEQTTNEKDKVKEEEKLVAPKSNNYENGHVGVAIPMTMEDIVREMDAVDIKLKESSTSKEGISTWILLSGSEPTAQPNMKGPIYRVESNQKIDKIIKIDDSIPVEKATSQPAPKKRIPPSIAKLAENRPKPKKTPTTTAASVDKKEEIIVEESKNKTNVAESSQERKQQSKTEGQEIQQEGTTKKPKRRTTTTRTTTTTATPQEETTVEPITEEQIVHHTPSSVESTTFLILEPKDADFDLPQDRSPGNLTTKKPKRPANKNNNNKQQNKKKNNVRRKKPEDKLDEGAKNSTKVANKPAQKEKPISTKIYNYLSREVMPTVGVGLVGLVVTAGLATYFLGPFAALRRSYDIADRKDDVYYNNNEEYAGPDGQYEEEWFSKVIAGSPTYRNNIRYHTYRPGSNPNQVHQQSQYAAYKYPQYSKYRNVPHYPPGAVAGTGNTPQQYQPPVQVQQASYQQNYRYNNDNPIIHTQKSISNSPVYLSSPPSQESPIASSDSDPPSDAVDSVDEQTKPADDHDVDNVLQHRSQFVVGSVVAADGIPEEETTVPEHGPRRKRATGFVRNIEIVEKKPKSLDDNEIDNENDVQGVIHVKVTTAAPVSKISTEILPEKEIPSATFISAVAEGENDEAFAKPVDDIEGTVPPPPNNNLFDFLKRVIELKIRYGISFLQNATKAFQRYLRGVEERVGNSALFNRN